MSKKKKYLNGELSSMYGGTAKRTAVARKSQTSDHDQMVKDNFPNYLQSHLDCNPKSELAILPTFSVRTLDKVERIVNKGEVSQNFLMAKTKYLQIVFL